MDESKTQMGDVFKLFINSGYLLFNAMRLAETEQGHCAAYYGFMRPEPGALIIDLGAGIGGYGHYLQQIDPSLYVVNVVNDAALIEYMNYVGRDCHYASFDDTGLPDGCADNAMFNESIGHGDLGAVIGEAARLLKIGGVLTIKDFSPINPRRNEVVFAEWGYRCSREDLVVSRAASNGLSLDCLVHPFGFREHWDACMLGDESVTKVVGGDQHDLPIRQVLYRFTKVC